MELSRRLKLTLLALAALGLVGLLMLNIGESRTIVVSAKPVGDITPSATTLVGVLQAPRYTGQSLDGSAWELTADAATQEAAHQGAPTPKGQNRNGQSHKGLSGSISLTTVQAFWKPTKGEPLALYAQSALYAPEATELTLGKGLKAVGVMGGYGLTLKAAQAQANLTSATLVLRGGVSAHLEPR